MLRTILAVAVLGFFACLVGLPLLLVAWLAGEIGPFYPAAVVGLRVALALAGVRVRVEGRENIPAAACLFMANHTSNVDPVAILVSVPRRVAYLAKQELFRIPLLGFAMQRAQFISVDRTSRANATKSADLAVKTLQDGVSMVIYPEGTRSADGRLGHFKRGAFLIAIQARAPVVPVTILGAERVLPRGERWLRPGEIRLQLHPPIDPAGYAPEDRQLLLDRVRAAIAASLPNRQL